MIPTFPNLPSFFRLALTLCLFAGLAACGRGPQVPQGPAGDMTNAAARWQAFTTFPAPTPAPVRMEGSLRFGPVGETNRVTYILWSNGELPLRMDVLAANAVQASVEVAGSTITAFTPRNQRAYRGTDAPDQALLALGLPLPINMARLNALLQGRYMEAMGDPIFQDSRPALQGDAISYTAATAGGNCVIELSPQARPVRWVFPQSWDVSITYDDASGLPSRIDGTLPGGTPYTFRSGGGKDFRFVLMVRSRTSVGPYARTELTLDLPRGVTVHNLDTQPDSIPTLDFPQ